jgi:CubicO group peptidase (beta-lactamase class C family)
MPDSVFKEFSDTSFAIKATIGNVEVFSHNYTAEPYIVERSVLPYDTQTRIGSVTKLFTVLAVILSQDKIAWEHSIRRYVPGLQGEVWDDVTVGSLCGHTSGLGRFVSGVCDWCDERRHGTMLTVCRAMSEILRRYQVLILRCWVYRM